MYLTNMLLVKTANKLMHRTPNSEFFLSGASVAPVIRALGTQKSKFILLVFSVANEYDIW